MTHNCPKLEKYLFLGISGRILAPATGGPGKSSYPEGSEYVWQRGVGSLQGRVTAAWSWPFQEKKNRLRRCYENPSGHNFDFRAKASWEKIFNIYKNFLSGGFRSTIKIVA